MSVPTHRASCQTWIYPTGCWYCGAPIHVLQCTCGSAVLLDMNHPPWEEHDCSATGTLGRSGLKGWAAVDVLRSAGVPISADIMSKVFPGAEGGKKPAAPSPPAMTAVKPKAGQKVTVLALVGNLLTSTKKTDELGKLGGVGAKLLQLPKGKLWQITLIVNSVRPNLSYTCVLPENLALPKDAKSKMVFAELAAKVAGDHAYWLITEIQLI
jgi:hypothetical protein